MPDFNRETVQEELVTLEAKIGRLENQLAEARAKRDTLKGTIEYFNPTPKRAPKRMANLGVEPDELHGMDLEDALVYVAERNNNVVTSGTVRPMLVDAGVLTGKQIHHKLSSTLRMSDRFENEQRGRYRLIEGYIPFDTTDT